MIYQVYLSRERGSGEPSTEILIFFRKIGDKERYLAWRSSSNGRGVADGETKKAHARSRLHNLCARWRSLSPIKCSYWVPEEKQDLWAGMAREEPGSQSSWEPVDCYEGWGGIQATVKRWDPEASIQGSLGLWNHPGVGAYFESLVSSVPCRTQAGTDSKWGHRATIYWKVTTVTLRCYYVSIMLYYAFGEIKLYKGRKKQTKNNTGFVNFIFKIMSGVKPFANYCICFLKKYLPKKIFSHIVTSQITVGYSSDISQSLLSLELYLE